MGEQIQKGEWVISSWLNQLTWLIKCLTLRWRGIIGTSGVIRFLLGQEKQVSLDALLRKDPFARSHVPVLCFCTGRSAAAASIHQLDNHDYGERHGKLAYSCPRSPRTYVGDGWFYFPLG